MDSWNDCMHVKLVVSSTMGYLYTIMHSVVVVVCSPFVPALQGVILIVSLLLCVARTLGVLDVLWYDNVCIYLVYV